MKKSETAELNFQQQGRTELERNYKDTVFVTVFHEKEKLIELYNAIFDTDYDKDTAIDIVTIKDVLFRTLKNDVSFVLDKRFVVLVEHQSSINGNLPLRDLLYMSTVLKRMIDTKQLYREKTVRIPRPASSSYITDRRISQNIRSCVCQMLTSATRMSAKKMLYNSSSRCII